MIGRIFMFLIMAFLGVIGISVNFRKDGSHNPFKISQWGYLFLSIGLVGFGFTIYYQIKDFTDNIKLQNDNIVQHITDSIKSEENKREWEFKFEQSQISLNKMNGKLDEKDSTNKLLISLNNSLVQTGHKIQEDQQFLFADNKSLLEQVSEYRKNIDIRDKNIERLNMSIASSKQGIFKTIKFKGEYIKQNGASLVFIEGTPEAAFFSKLDSASNAGRPTLLLNTAEEGIKLSPYWMTPYLYKGWALILLRKTDLGLDYLKLVEENTYGDIEYTNALANVYTRIGDESHAKQLIEYTKSIH